ncbi:MAG: TolC family outer membrane protein [Cohaesibacter sp.]|nr:TolC family outer membrane protein [Cohaesibacter sp.]
MKVQILIKDLRETTTGFIFILTCLDSRLREFDLSSVMFRRQFFVKFLQIFSVSLILSPSPSFAERGMSLRQAVDNAIQSNPRILGRSSEKKIEQARLRQATGRYLPTVDVSADIGKQNIDQPKGLSSSRNDKWRTQRQGSVELGWVLFEGFDRANQVYGQIARINAAGLRVIEESERVALETTEAYLDVLRHRHILQIVRNNVQTHRRYLDKIENSFSGGNALRGDVVQAKERLAAAQALIGEVEQALGIVNAKFVNLVGQKPAKLKAVSIPLNLPQNVRQALRLARSEHPSLRALDKDIDAISHDRDRLKSGYLPTVKMVGRGSYGENVNATPGKREEAYVGLRLSMNIFNGGITKAREDEQIERLAGRKIYKDQLIREIDQSVRTAWVTMATNDKRQIALRNQVREAQTLVSSYEKEYDAGQRSYLDLLTADGNLTNLRMELASTKTLSLFSRYQLLASLGGLLDSFQIVAPVGSEQITKPGSALGYSLSNGFVIKSLSN